jgi:hypothetical protein
MPFRVSYFFSQQGDRLGGWSENYWSNDPDITTLINTHVDPLATALYNLRGNGTALNAVRISDVSTFRSAQIFQYSSYFTPPQGNDFDSDYVTSAALVKLLGPPQYLVRQWYRGVPDNCVKMDGRWQPTTSWTNFFNAYKAIITNGANNWALRTIDKGQAKKVVVNVSLTGVVTVSAHGYSTNDRIRISRTGGIPGLNKIWTVQVIDANTFQLIAIPVGGFTGGYTKPGTAQKQVILFQQITGASVLRASKHDTGRPFGLLSGRRKRRTA